MNDLARQFRVNKAEMDNLPGPGGTMRWTDNNTWAANLVYQGFSDWRLP
jgi:hypothetical protein